MKKQKQYHIHKHALTLLHDLLILGTVLGVIVVLVGPPLGAFIARHKQQPQPGQILGAPEVKKLSLPPAQPASYGVAFGDRLRGLSPAELDVQMADLAAVGFGWLRTDFDWWALQPNNATSWDWAQYDKVVAAAGKHNIKILAVLTRTPPWARPASCTDDNCAPASTSAYGKYVHDVVTRYAPQGVHAYEIWNEPNLAGFWAPKASAATYTMFLKEAYTQIKKVDPLSTVVSGGISSLDDNPNSVEQVRYLQQMYTAGAQPYFDALGYHAYSYPVLPNTVRTWSGWSKISALTPSLRSVMKASGDDKKLIWVTEFGAPTDGPGGVATTQGYIEGQQPYHMTEQAQAESARQAVAYVDQSPWMAALFWYGYKDIGTDRSDNENFFGLRKFDNTPKLVYSLFAQLLKK